MKAARNDDMSARAYWLTNEIKRISSVALRGNFSDPADREFMVARLKKLSSELSAIEQLSSARGKAAWGTA